MSGSDPIAVALAEHWGLSDPSRSPIAGGLLHQSFSVPGDAVEYVLQRVSPVFSPGIHDNIAAVTEHLHARGVATFRLLRTRSGQPYADLGAHGIWRLLTREPGVTFDTCTSLAQARSAGRLVAGFHSALADLDFEFRPLGFPFHVTPVHLRDLEEAVLKHPEHRLHADVAALAAEIGAEAQRWIPLDGLPLRVAHGDLKFNNILFAGPAGPEKERATSLIDLDTLQRAPLWIELGDAWRSWCNRSGEDSERAELDLEVFAASVEGYRAGLTIEFEPAELASLVDGLERIALELAARFAADALAESYFRWDAERFGSAGEHNLVRARGQLSLYHQARETRGERARLLGVPPDSV